MKLFEWVLFFFFFFTFSCFFFHPKFNKPEKPLVCSSLFIPHCSDPDSSSLLTKATSGPCHTNTNSFAHPQAHLWENSRHSFQKVPDIMACICLQSQWLPISISVKDSVFPMTLFNPGLRFSSIAVPTTHSVSARPSPFGHTSENLWSQGVALTLGTA